MRLLSMIVKTSTSPAAEPASPAREILARHLKVVADCRGRFDAISRVHDEAANANAQECAAKDRLDAITEQEEADWVSWSANPIGPPPRPRTVEREDALRCLAAARGEAESLARAAASQSSSIEEAASEYRRLVERRTDLVAAVLVEEARKVAKEYDAACYDRLRCEQELKAIAKVLFALNHGGDVQRAFECVTTSALASTRADLLAMEPRTDRAWKTLADRLGEDPDATIEEIPR